MVRARAGGPVSVRLQVQVCSDLNSTVVPARCQTSQLSHGGWQCCRVGPGRTRTSDGAGAAGARADGRTRDFLLIASHRDSPWQCLGPDCHAQRLSGHFSEPEPRHGRPGARAEGFRPAAALPGSGPGCQCRLLAEAIGVNNHASDSDKENAASSSVPVRRVTRDSESGPGLDIPGAGSARLFTDSEAH